MMVRRSVLVAGLMLLLAALTLCVAASSAAAAPSNNAAGAEAGFLVTSFPDVPANFWARREILAVANAGIVFGFPGGNYRPGLEVTRDQLAVFIARALAGGDAKVPPGPDTPTFSDVPTTYWAYKYIEYCLVREIVGGFPDGTYRPTLAVTRDQMAVFIARSIVIPTGDEGLESFVPPATPTFKDVGTDFWASKWIEFLASRGIVQGFFDGTFRPKLVVTRDQMAVFIQRAFDVPLPP